MTEDQAKRIVLAAHPNAKIEVVYQLEFNVFRYIVLDGDGHALSYKHRTKKAAWVKVAKRLQAKQ